MKIKYDKIINRKNNLQVRIRVTGYTSGVLFGYIVYDAVIFYRHLPEKKWNICFDENAPEYQDLNYNEKKIFKDLKELEYVSSDEIYEAKIECWEKLKPEKE